MQVSYSITPQYEVFSDKDQIYDWLMEQNRNLSNTAYLAKMIASLYSDQGAMPAYLGLEPVDFDHLTRRHFYNITLPKASHREILDTSRAIEREDLVTLFYDHRAADDPEIELIGQIIIAGCMGGNHLWQDLGLWSRNDVSNLIRLNFPELYKKNIKNMKWKKFIYKQLCIGEGIYVCRAPSCEVCDDFKVCFGPEEE